MPDSGTAHPAMPSRELEEQGPKTRSPEVQVDRPERRRAPPPPEPAGAARVATDEEEQAADFDDYDETVAESFPASDPPSGTMHAGPPRHRR